MNKHIYQKQNVYAEWHPSVVKKVNEEYHILKDGVLNKKDFSLLFENADEKLKSASEKFSKSAGNIWCIFINLFLKGISQNQN